MKVAYTFETLEDVAKHFEHLSDIDAQSAAVTRTKRRALILREASATWQSAARIIRNTTIGSKQDEVA